MTLRVRSSSSAFFLSRYDLPSTIMTKATGFGSSTRADWEGTRMNKRDMNNPNAGPASYDITTECILSDSTKRRPRRQVRVLQDVS